MQGLKRNPHGGDLFVFRGRAGSLIKIIWHDGIGMANTAAEGALRCSLLGRKAWLFCGSDRSGERAAIIYTLIQTAKFNDVDPQAWLADALARITDHPAPGSMGSCFRTERSTAKQSPHKQGYRLARITPRPLPGRYSEGAHSCICLVV